MTLVALGHWPTSSITADLRTLALFRKISGRGCRRPKAFARTNSFLHALIDGNDPFDPFEDIQNLRTRMTTVPVSSPTTRSHLTLIDRAFEQGQHK